MPGQSQPRLRTHPPGGRQEETMHHHDDPEGRARPARRFQARDAVKLASRGAAARDPDSAVVKPEPGPALAAVDPYDDTGSPFAGAPQFTLRAVLTGAALGTVIGASNMYLGFKTGFSFGAQLFGSILGFAILKPLSSVSGAPFGPKVWWDSGGLRENCTVQTVATAAGGLTVIFTSAIPAMYKLELLGSDVLHDIPRLLAVTFCGSYFGLFFAIPLRRYFVVRHGDKVGGRFLPSWLDWAGVSNRLTEWGFMVQWTLAFVGAGILVGINASFSYFVGNVAGYGLVGPLMIAIGACVEPFTGFPKSKLAEEPTPRYWLLFPAVMVMLIASFTEVGLHGKALFERISLFLRRRTDRKEEVVVIDVSVPDAPKDQQVPSHWWMGGVAFSVLVTLLVLYFQFGLVMGGISSAEGDFTKTAKTVNLTAGLVSAASASHAVGFFVVFAKAYPCITSVDDIKCQFAMPSVFAWKVLADALTSPDPAIPFSSGVAAVALSAVAMFGVILQHRLPAKYKVYVLNFNALSIGLLVPTSSFPFAMILGAVFSRAWARRSPESHKTLAVALASGLIAGEGVGGVVIALLTIFGVDGSRFGTSALCPISGGVDRLWSILPCVYAWHFALRDLFGAFNSGDYHHALDVRTLLMAVLVTIWGARLTYNFARYAKGGYKYGSEDYRWAALREMMPSLAFQALNVTFIAAFQNFLLLALALPAYVSWRAKSCKPHITWLDVLAALLFLFFVGLETLAGAAVFLFGVTFLNLG
ncbi:MAG: OPT oligopeptide transporter protein-domain-containing protein [Olpidium bornovanus]|uniref:OPT oligopeptide transporter protein-domain-containing protein n=1 Tax=Olpidium bornovanus TaxID=278681 RepID=A0A8H7ZXX7_9FUNG|nr:MAG: OPT oligopeptide transporter protein-domain-containing protein [Olpidium bornovanus]